MPAIDDRLRAGLEHLAEPDAGDANSAFERVSARRAQRRIVHRAQSAALVIGVVVGVALGTLILLRTFQPEPRPARPGPVAADG